MKLRPIFVEVLPEFDAIKTGELWITHKHRTVNLRCPCGCGELTGAVPPPQSMARSLRWEVGLPRRSLQAGPFGLIPVAAATT